MNSRVYLEEMFISDADIRIFMLCQKLVTTTRQRRVACSPLRGSGHSLFEHISYRFTPPVIDWWYKMYENTFR